MIGHTVFDWDRDGRTGVAEAIYAEGKTDRQIIDVLTMARDKGRGVLVTRLDAAKAAKIDAAVAGLDYDDLSRTALMGPMPQAGPSPSVGIVTAGTSDLAVAGEAARSLAAMGLSSQTHADLGVAGIWRLLERIDAIDRHDVVIACAGMEAALFSVLSGLVRAPIIAVPTSVGYGVAQGGQAALTAALASCAPGLVCVNIDNGFGAAAAARKFLSVRGVQRAQAQREDSRAPED